MQEVGGSTPPGSTSSRHIAGKGFRTSQTMLEASVIEQGAGQDHDGPLRFVIEVVRPPPTKKRMGIALMSNAVRVDNWKRQTETGIAHSPNKKA